jgi:putative ATP-dependent endonuclease of OLD family
MQLSYLRIKNFKSFKDECINVGSHHALVGANNSGKSGVLKALDFLLNPSKKNIDEESWYHCLTDEPIWIEAIFTELSGSESESLKGYLRDDGSFHIARSATAHEEQIDGEFDFDISQHFQKSSPKFPWLNPSSVSAKAIKEWDEAGVADTEINGKKFRDYLPSRKVGDWKQAIEEFCSDALLESDYIECWHENPAGYSSVLKSILPAYIYVPAVRDVKDEAKYTASSPFGKLLKKILENVAEERKAEVEVQLKSVAESFNRNDNGIRIQQIDDLESSINGILSEYMPAEIEIEFETPSFDKIIQSPRLFSHDGFRSSIENKGHGLQRAVILSILRAFAQDNNDALNNTIFGIEEPEIYMHPQAQRTLRRVFKQLSDGGSQLFYSTHSSLLLDIVHFDEIVRLERNDSDNGAYSICRQISPGDLISDIENRIPSMKGVVSSESIRQHYHNAYHQNKSEGFFAQKVILVEGATESYCLPLRFEASEYNLDYYNISVIECGGKGQMDRLYRVFNELGIACYIVFDFDQGSTDSGSRRTSKGIMELVGCSEEFNDDFLVIDNLCAFRITWEHYMESSISSYSEYKCVFRAIVTTHSV